MVQRVDVEALYHTNVAAAAAPHGVGIHFGLGNAHSARTNVRWVVAPNALQPVPDAGVQPTPAPSPPDLTRPRRRALHGAPPLILDEEEP